MIENTEEFVHVNIQGNVRVWKGTTDSGAEVLVVVAAIACDDPAECRRFERELTELHPTDLITSRTVSN